MLALLLALALADPAADPEPVRIPVGRSALIELPAEARSLSVTDETTVAPRQLYPTLSLADIRLYMGQLFKVLHTPNPRH